ncbi:MAG: zinc-ribbon domain-containing protein [Sneathiella sp.]
MILTCSSCSTRYLIDPASVGADGRTVKCAKCGHKWREYPPADMPKQVTEEVAEDVAAPDPDPTPAAAGMSIQEMTKKPKAKRPAEKKKSILWPLLKWLLLLVILGGLAAGAFYGRDYVVKFLPASAKLYQALKIDVKIANKLGVEIRDYTSKSVSENGVIKLTVSGKIVNVTGTKRPVPRINIQLVDSKGQHVYSWSTTADQESVDPWGSVAFSSSMNQPPEEAKHVKFNLIAPKKPAAEEKQ